MNKNHAIFSTSFWMEPVQVPEKPDISDSYFEPYVIDDDDRFYQDLRPAQLVCCPLTVSKPVKKAVLYATAHGIYTLYLNGQRIGNQEFAPEFSPYQKCLMYQSYDITPLLKISNPANAAPSLLTMVVAGGWWCGHVGLSGDNCQYGDRLAILLECHIEYEDGDFEIKDFSEAKSSPSHIRYADLSVGEYCDASAAPDWRRDGLNRNDARSGDSFGDDNARNDAGTHWLPLKKIDLPMDNLVPQIGDGVQIIKRLTPHALKQMPDGSWILDVGQNIAGYLEISLDAKAGCKITLEHTEMLDEKGEFLRCIKGRHKEQRDVYITCDGQQSWHPSFTYHGFRYVKITGWPGVPSLSQFHACVLSTPLRRTGFFECSDARLNKLHENIWWSQLANTISIPTDCPQREKAGWTGDAMIYSETMCLLSDAEAFLRRWLSYCRAEQCPDGSVPMVVPYLRQYEKFAAKVGSHTSAGWGDAIVIIPWNLYFHSGNVEILEENYAAMKAWASYAESHARNGLPANFSEMDSERQKRQTYLWNTDFCFGDWLLPSVMKQPGAVPMDSAAKTAELMASAYYANTIWLMEKVAGVLKEQEDANYYHDLHEKIRAAFMAEYVRPDGTLTHEFQGAYVVSLKFHLVPRKLRAQTARRLCELIAQNDDCLDTGFLSVHLLLDVLAETGHADVAYKLLFQTKCPGWLYMIEHGATTIWEKWDCIGSDGSIGAYSYNHYAFGCVGKWFYTRLAGIVAQAPGYRKVRIRPGHDSGLTHVRATVETPYGPLTVAWEILSGTLRVETVIPKEIDARLSLPGREIKLANEKSQNWCSLID